MTNFYSVSFEKFAVCGARYKTRPGLTYHYGHSHRDGASDENSRESVPSSSTGTSGAVGAGAGGAAGAMMGGVTFGGHSLVAGGMGGGGIMTGGQSGAGSAAPFGPGAAPDLTAAAQQPGGQHGQQIPPVYQDSYVTFLNHPAGTAFIFFTLFIYYFYFFCVCRVPACE